MKVWKWYLQEFLHKDPLGGDAYDLVIGPLNTLGNTMPDEFTDLLIAELETDDVLLNNLIYYRILERDKDSVLIEKIGDNNNPYFVSADFLRTVSKFQE